MEVVAFALQEQASGPLKRFYAERGFRPLWAATGRLGPAAETFVAYLGTASQDGLKSSAYRPEELAEAIAQARGGNPAAAAHAELALSAAFSRYVNDQRKSRVKMDYGDPSLKPRKLTPEQILRAAAFPASFRDYVAKMGWMSAAYVHLRDLMARAEARSEIRERLLVNLDRARLLPSPWVRHVVVDASSGMLWYYEAGKQVGMMKVVVGAKETQTPMLAGKLQWAIVNPYWNVPDYLVRDNIAPKVLSGRTLDSMHVEALADWSANSARIDPMTINWQAVAAGKEDLRLRELPGPANSMGKVKFLFPNDEGIYLHDTPNRDLFEKPDRHFSNGCIRLDNAAALGKWLLQKPVPTHIKAVEQPVPLPVQTPVYLTYITAISTDGGIAFRDDIYGRDG